ncbi:MAG: DnaA regulatory inactivator Hda [Gammaproteobacteria bacterium]|nr:DnaA regulatory inactivator Hda [Gammaproteobacteria bacterium]
MRLHDRALFASYLPGPNAQVLAQLAGLAAQPRAGFWWLCGPAGSGKTHLLQALCAAAGQGAQYVPLSELAPYGPAALAEWQGARWACLDEAAVVIGKRDWETALFSVYRDCEERGACLVIAAREIPPQLAFALPDLASRCAAGLRLTLRALGELEQLAALQLRAQQRGFELPDETARYLQRRLPRDMRSLFAVLDELDAAALAAQRRLTVPFIRDVLARP